MLLWYCSVRGPYGGVYRLQKLGALKLLFIWAQFTAVGGRISESPNLHVLKFCIFWMLSTRNIFFQIWASSRRWARCLQSPTVAAATCSGGEGGHKTLACGASTLANSPATTTFKQQQQQQQNKTTTTTTPLEGHGGASTLANLNQTATTLKQQQQQQQRM